MCTKVHSGPLYDAGDCPIIMVTLGPNMNRDKYDQVCNVQMGGETAQSFVEEDGNQVRKMPDYDERGKNTEKDKRRPA